MQLCSGLSLWWSESVVGNRIKIASRQQARAIAWNGRHKRCHDFEIQDQASRRCARRAIDMQFKRRAVGRCSPRPMSTRTLDALTRPAALWICRPCKPSPAALPSLRENGAAARVFAQMPHASHWARHRSSRIDAAGRFASVPMTEGRHVTARCVRPHVASHAGWPEVLDQSGSQERCRTRHVFEDP